MTVISGRLMSESDQVAFGTALARALLPGTVVYLEGELGAGKTTLARGVAWGLGHEGAVKSPTYTLVEPYQHLRIPLYHFDLYRLGEAEELDYLGVRDYFDQEALVLIEWPGRGEGYLPAPDLTLRLEVTPPGRQFAIAAHSPRGEQCLTALDARPWLTEEATP